jgi:beta-lactam-binding protein with PASTA domain
VQVVTEPEPTVPDLRGLNCDEARTILAQHQLILAACERGKPDGATPSAQINAQEPRAGSSAPADRRVRAWTAPPRVEVPHVEGLSADAARSRLAASTLQAHFTGPSTQLGARVQAQQPAAGSNVEEGSAVTLQMEFVVPDLRGKTCDEAGKLAAEYGLQGVACVVSRVADSGSRVGTVYAQEPAAATTLAAPAKIKVQVVAEPLHTVPELVDQTTAEAQRHLSQVGLRARVDVVGPADRRVVVAALPPAGTQVEPGSTVMLTTVALVEVPPLTGKTCTEAQEALAPLGLNFVCSSRWPVLLAPIVDAQIPVSPSLVRAGSTVTGTAPPDWRRGGLLVAALLAGTALLVPVSRRAIFRRWRDPGRTSTGTPTLPTLPTLALRGEPDSLPRITVRADGTPLDWPALNVRGEAGTPRYFLNLSDREDDDGST